MCWSQAISGNSHYSSVLWLSAHEVDFLGGELKFHNGSRPQSARRRPWLSVAPAAGSAVTFLEGKHCMFSYQWDVSSQAICQLLL